MNCSGVVLSIAAVNRSTYLLGSKFLFGLLNVASFITAGGLFNVMKLLGDGLFAH